MEALRSAGYRLFLAGPHVGSEETIGALPRKDASVCEVVHTYLFFKDPTVDQIAMAMRNICCFTAEVMSAFVEAEAIAP